MRLKRIFMTFQHFTFSPVEYKMKHLQISSARDPIEEMVQAQAIIAMEAEFLSNFSATVNNVIPKLVGATTEFFNKIRTMGFAPTSENTTIPRFRPEVIHLIQKHDYGHLANMAAFVPEGFNGNFLEYSTYLVKCASHINEVQEKVLKPYNAFLASIISDGNSVMSSTDRLMFLQKIEKVRQELTEEAAKYFRAGSTATRQDIGKVTRRNREWEELSINLAAIARTISSMDNVKVMDEVNTTVVLLDALKKSVKSGELNAITPTQLRSLSLSTMTVAREVEFYAVSRFRISVFNVAVDDTLTMLKSALTATA
jgi:hypothetical protein